MAGIGPVAAPPAHFTHGCHGRSLCVLLSGGGPFLLLQSTLSCVERILQRSSGQPLRRTWIEFPYGEEEITLLEEEVIPAIQQCLQRVDAIDAALQEEQEARIAIEQLRQQLAAVAEGSDALMPL